MEERDLLRSRAKSTNNPEDWSEWKILKNRVNRLVRKEKARQRENTIFEVSKDTTTKKLWNYVKSKACWTTSMAPTILKASENDFTTSPQRMAKILNDYFVQKVNTI